MFPCITEHSVQYSLNLELGFKSSVCGNEINNPPTYFTEATENAKIYIDTISKAKLIRTFQSEAMADHRKATAKSSFFPLHPSELKRMYLIYEKLASKAISLRMESNKTSGPRSILPKNPTTGTRDLLR